VDPVVLASARKHRIPDADMLHAYRHPIQVFDLDDLTMLIGADATGRMLEIGVAIGDGVEFIAHAMPAREKFLR
jgi:predicted O-methyltransferase YrrM